MSQHHHKHATHDGKLIPDADIRLCAYRKWESAGRPTGDGIRFWLEAEQELVKVKNEKFAQREGWHEQRELTRLEVEKKVSEDSYYRDNNRMFQGHGERGRRHGSS